MRYYLDTKPDEPATEIRYVIMAAFRSGAASLDLAPYMQWDVHRALTEISRIPLGWEVFQWLARNQIVKVDGRQAEQIEHLRSVAHLARILYHGTIRDQLLSEMNRMRPRFATDGAATLVPIIEALGIDAHNARDFDHFHGDNSALFSLMFQAALEMMAKPAELPAAPSPAPAPASPEQDARP